MKIDRFGFNNFLLAITQECNLACRHCFRGDARHGTIKDQTIYNALTGMRSIRCLTLTGGEVLLHPEKLLVVKNAILKNDIDVYRVSILTNATVWNSEVQSALLKLKTTPKKCLERFKLTISCDEFHKEEIKRLGLKDYSDEIVDWGKDNKVEVGFKDLDSIARIGRAKTLEYKDIPRDEHNTINGYPMAKYDFCNYTIQPTREAARADLVKPVMHFILDTCVNVDGSVGGMTTDWDYFDNPKNVLFNVNDMSFKDYLNSQPEIEKFKD